MIRKGRFAIWCGKEYTLISYQRQYYLRSEDRAELKNGFIQVEGDTRAFIRKVAISELENAYEVFPYAMLMGYRFTVEGYNEKMHTIALVTNNPFVKNKVDVKPYGKFEYIIEVPVREVEIEEDRIPILGFEVLSI